MENFEQAQREYETKLVYPYDDYMSKDEYMDLYEAEQESRLNEM